MVSLASIPPDAEPASDRSRNALQKVFAILDVFSRRRRSLTLSQISRASGLPVSTVHRLLTELTAWGALERTEEGEYQVGLRIWELGALAPRSTGLVDTALPFLEDLYEATHENVRLGVREDHHVMFVAHLAGHGSVRLRTRPATRLPMPTTGVGLVLLAHAPLDVLEAILAADLPRFTPHTVPDTDALRRMLATVRRDGYAICDQQMTTGAVAVAAPIRGAGGEVVASVSVAVRGEGPAAVREYIPGVLVAANGISRALQRGAPAP